MAFFPPGEAQPRYWAAIMARRTAQGDVVEEPRPRRLPVHPARTFGCGGGGLAADPRMPLPALDRLWAPALRNWLDGVPPGTLGLRLPSEALAWLRAHTQALPPTCALATEDIVAVLEQDGMAGSA